MPHKSRQIQSLLRRDQKTSEVTKIVEAVTNGSGFYDPCLMNDHRSWEASDGKNTKATAKTGRRSQGVLCGDEMTRRLSKKKDRSTITFMIRLKVRGG